MKRKLGTYILKLLTKANRDLELRNMNNRAPIEKCAERYDSFYLYDEKGILEALSKLKRCFPDVSFLYSIKCNSNPHVLNCIFGQGFGADAASLGEVLLASEAGLTRNQIYYSAPGKTAKEIEGASTKATLIADSLDEVARIQQVAARTGGVFRVGLRINPDFTFDNSHGLPSKFGIDEEQAVRFLQKYNYENVEINGIHVHLKSQELNPDNLAAYYDKMFGLAKRFYDICGGLEYVNMGSGIGVPYAESDTPLDLPYLGKFVQEHIRKFREICPGTRVIIELGRFAVCKHGVYVTKVLDRKESYGKTFVILKNTMNGFLRPSLAKLVERYTLGLSQTSVEPLFTCANAFQFLPLTEHKEVETVTLVGNLCTAADVIAENVVLPHLECGDCVVITNAGGYAAVLSPMQFSSQDRPIEIFMTQDGELIT